MVLTDTKVRLAKPKAKEYSLVSTSPKMEQL